MGLSGALTSALSGLRVSQESMSVLSQNIANVNNESYSRRIIEQKSASLGGLGAGVDIAAISRKLDESLQTQIRNQKTTAGRLDAIKEVNDSIQILHGNPDGDNSLHASLTNFFTAMGSLAANPEIPSLRSNAVIQSKSLTDKISTIARELETLRFETDKEVKKSFDTVNNFIQNIHALNIAIKDAQTVTADTTTLEEERDNLLSKLAEQLEITVFEQEDGGINIAAASGQSLLDASTYRIDYSPATSVDVMIQDASLGSVTLGALDLNGNIGATVEIVSGGTESNITSKILNGRIKGLMEMRDIEIPRMLAQLDTLAAAIRDNVNAIHNDGGGFPAASTLTGSESFLGTDRRDFSGSVRIGLVDANGKPLTRGDGTKLNPLTLDLGSLDTGNGVGSPTVNGIIKEINEYFFLSPTMSRTNVGDLYDVKLASRQTTIAAGNFAFDFELDNNVDTNTQFELLNITVGGGGALVSPVMPVAAQTLTPGARERTSTPVTVNLVGGGPYTIDAQVRVTDADGIVTTSTIQYTVAATTGGNDDRNTRFIANAITAGGGSIVAAGTTQKFAKAELVNASGNVVAAADPGFLRIKSESTGYHIVIDELTSQDLGLLAVTPSIAATNKGFSHFFGLNNLFTSGTSTSSGSAINLQTRSDIVNNPNLLSMGELVQSPNTVETQSVGVVQARGTMLFSANPAAADTITVNGTVFTFVAGAPVGNQIQIGANLAATMTNIAARLNGVVDGVVDRATYTSNGTDTLTVVHDAPGTDGNAFTLASNTAVIGISLNDAPSATTTSGGLLGGLNENQSVNKTPNTYEIGVGSNKIVDRLSALSLTTINFAAAGTLPATSNTLGGYAADVTSYAAIKARNATGDSEKQELFVTGFVDRLRQSSGVNLDEELANTIIFQNSYTASARVISTTQQLFDVLFDTI